LKISPLCQELGLTKEVNSKLKFNVEYSGCATKSQERARLSPNRIKRLSNLLIDLFQSTPQNVEAAFSLDITVTLQIVGHCFPIVIERLPIMVNQS
jgi:hypothetical protein